MGSATSTSNDYSQSASGSLLAVTNHVLGHAMRRNYFSFVADS
jgi:hypothetical protein